jgi:CRP/FNR family transcriptional regulator, cyclic AMP receptor protein
MKRAAPRAPEWSSGSFMARLTPRRRESLLELGVCRAVPSGRVLFREGESETTHAEILVTGYVKVTTVAEGVEALLSVRGPGDVLGETATLTGRPRTATVTTSGPVTSLVIARADFRRYLDRFPDVALAMAATMGERLRWANRRRSEITAFPADVRLARLLVDLGSTYGLVTDEGVRIGVMLSQSELATMVGIAEATAQKAIRDLRRDGLIRTGYRSITIVDLETLRGKGEVDG